MSEQQQQQQQQQRRQQQQQQQQTVEKQQQQYFELFGHWLVAVDINLVRMKFTQKIIELLHIADLYFNIDI